jgi:hypothetical protein
VVDLKSYSTANGFPPVLLLATKYVISSIILLCEWSPPKETTMSLPPSPCSHASGLLLEVAYHYVAAAAIGQRT